MKRIPAKHVTRERKLTKAEAAKYKKIREEFENDPRPADTKEPLVTQGEYWDLRFALHDLKQRRERLGKTLAQLEAETGISQRRLSRLENGKITNPRWSTLVAYARALGARLILSDEDSSEAPRNAQDGSKVVRSSTESSAVPSGDDRHS